LQAGSHEVKRDETMKKTLTLNSYIKWDKRQGKSLPKRHSSPTPTPPIPNAHKIKNSLTWDKGQGKSLPKNRHSSPTPTPPIPNFYQGVGL